jgi:stringent starvation protein B
MGKLVEKKIYVPVWNVSCYARQQGFVNIFDLHKRLDDMIRIHHLPQRKSIIYIHKEKKYMEEFIRSRKINEDMGLYVVN